MGSSSRRALSLHNLRAFEAVARLLSFKAAADELFLTQPAISRQIQSLEDEVGAPLFVRGTRSVQLAPAGVVLLKAVAPGLAKVDAAVHSIRRSRSRRRVAVTTFASFGSLWLLPRIEAFQREHADIDIHVSAQDALVALDDPELDLALRYVSPSRRPASGSHLFDETLTPVVSRGLWQQIERGEAPPLRTPDDLAGHTLAEEADDRSGWEFLSWRSWLDAHGLPPVQPRRWIYLTYTYQQVQAALAGQGVALARVPLVLEALQRGELVEPFGPAARVTTPYSYWMLVAPESAARPEVARFAAWVEDEAKATREAVARLSVDTASGASAPASATPAASPTTPAGPATAPAPPRSAVKRRRAR